MELYLSPNGRIDQPTYWRAVLILFGVSTVLNVIGAFVSTFLGFLAILVIWPWIAVHVKRFHDSGKTGWLTLAIVVLAFIVSFVLSLIVPALFGIDQAAMQAEIQRETEMAMRTDPSAAFSAAMEASQDMARRMVIPGIVQSAIVTGIIGAVMGALNKTDPNDNQYGPGPAGAGSTFV